MKNIEINPLEPTWHQEGTRALNHRRIAVAVARKKELLAEDIAGLAEVHKLDFVRGISRLAGIGPFDFAEPYLEGLLRRFTRQQEEALDLLELKLQLEAEKLPEAAMKAAIPAGNIDGLINGKLREFDGETTRRLTASLNGHRQQAVGVEQYRWRTQGDEKVRESHAHNANEVFLWDSPPPTGHPGSDFGCRCWAEPVVDEGTIIKKQIFEEGITQHLLTQIVDTEPKWNNDDFIRHFYQGGGVGVTLSEIGHLREIIDVTDKKHDIFNKVNMQVADKAKSIVSGNFHYPFWRSYNFSSVSFSHGDATIKGIFIGGVREEDGLLIISGIVTYQFYDEFTDPLSIRENIFGGSGAGNIPDWFTGLTDGGGKLYVISDSWQTELKGVIRAE